MFDSRFSDIRRTSRRRWRRLSPRHDTLRPGSVRSITLTAQARWANKSIHADAVTEADAVAGETTGRASLSRFMPSEDCVKICRHIGGTGHHAVTVGWRWSAMLLAPPACNIFMTRDACALHTRVSIHEHACHHRVAATRAVSKMMPHAVAVKKFSGYGTGIVS